MISDESTRRDFLKTVPAASALSAAALAAPAPPIPFAAASRWAPTPFFLAPARKRGMTLYARILEGMLPGQGVGNIDEVVTRDIHGRPATVACWNYPEYITSYRPEIGHPHLLVIAGNHSPARPGVEGAENALVHPALDRAAWRVLSSCQLLRGEL
jgi:hypothetical protein